MLPLGRVPLLGRVSGALRMLLGAAARLRFSAAALRLGMSAAAMLRLRGVPATVTAARLGSGRGRHGQRRNAGC
jgi:hypothetical protein